LKSGEVFSQWASAIVFTEPIFLENPIWFFQSIQLFFSFTDAFGISMDVSAQVCPKQDDHGGRKNLNGITSETKK